jgi:hypothetical protein
VLDIVPQVLSPQMFSPEVMAGLVLFAIVLILAGNFVLCTMCCPFFSTRQRRCLRALFGISLIAILGLAYSLKTTLIA